VGPTRSLQPTIKAATILTLDGLAKSKQDPINRGHGAQYLYRPPPAGAQHAMCKQVQSDAVWQRKGAMVIAGECAGDAERFLICDMWYVICVKKKI